MVINYCDPDTAIVKVFFHPLSKSLGKKRKMCPWHLETTSVSDWHFIAPQASALVHVMMGSVVCASFFSGGRKTSHRGQQGSKPPCKSKLGSRSSQPKRLDFKLTEQKYQLYVCYEDIPAEDEFYNATMRH